MPQAPDEAAAELGLAADAGASGAVELDWPSAGGALAERAFGVSAHGFHLQGRSLAPLLVRRYSTVGGLEGMTVSLQEPGGLEFAQALSEHAGRDAGDCVRRTR